LKLVQGDLFESVAQTLVNPVNTAGVMGKGLAAEFRRRPPDMFEEYRTMCQRGEFGIGDLYLYKGADKWVLNFPTKVHWRSKSKLAYIEAGLETFAAKYAQWGIASVAFPALGCGLGGLDFEPQVRPLMVRYLSDLDIPVELYPPGQPLMSS